MPRTTLIVDPGDVEFSLDAVELDAVEFNRFAGAKLYHLAVRNGSLMFRSCRPEGCTRHLRL